MPTLSLATTDAFNRQLSSETPEAIIEAALSSGGGLRAGVLSSFGAEAAVLLSLVSRVAPATPVIFLDTGMHFLQTLSYRDQLIRHFGLTDVRIVTPSEPQRLDEDPMGALWRSDTDACCDLRKTRPLDRALADIDLVITGRKRHQTADRSSMQAFELFEWRIRANPLMNWSADQVEAYFEAEQLPRHPLVAHGYPSIGCWPCTRSVEADEDQRAGRWSGATKTECGIHLDRRAVAAH